MEQTEIQQILARQREFFATGATLDVTYRIEALTRLRDAIRRREDEINEALAADLGKSRFESYMCEVGLACSELTHMIKHARAYAKERRVRTPLAQFAAKSYVKPVPYGVTLIMSPWNYPFMLTIDPLADALAAGNTAVLKPSAYSPRTSAVLQSLIEECFDPAYVAVVTGGRAENSCLLEEKFDHIFFTGSQSVGREVMRHAAAHLTPVTLELGGKSPCIVDRTANLKLAAKRIVFGKFLNCGQTCVAPDYVYCDETVHNQLLSEISRQIKLQFGEHPLDNGDYGKIINQKHFDRICALIDPSKVAFGGATQPESCRIEPTVLDRVTWDDPVMQEEIFGPVLPILTYRNIDEATEQINHRAHPLALYLFTEDKAQIRRVTAACQFGGGCINDTIIHLATSNMAFGGVGESGMGGYHGKVGFDTFSHHKSIVNKRTWMDLPMRYQPYRNVYDKMIRIFLK
jgi:aldehyde dehydrogenase (NAD+)